MLVLNEEQQMLKTSAAEFLKDKAPVSALRLLRDTRDATGYDKALWSEMAEMGWACLTIPETYGGLDFGYTGLGQILEEMGRTLTASPMIGTVVLGATAISLTGNEAQKSALLSAIAEGSLTIAFAIDEKSRHNPSKIKTTATADGDGYTVSGKKVFVLDGHVADKYIVVANEGDETGLFIVNSDDAGVSAERRIMMDSRNAAIVKFDNAKAIKLENSNAATIEKVLDIGRICLSAEMLGATMEAFERTVQYLQTRTQFGNRIGSFQALQHRASIMFCEIEVCKSLVIKSLQAIDSGDDLAVLASMTKAKLSETIELVTNEGIQLHGGIGMTDDEEIGFFMKRARVAQMTLGDVNYHLDRMAAKSGY